MRADDGPTLNAGWVAFLFSSVCVCGGVTPDRR